MAGYPTVLTTETSGDGVWKRWTLDEDGGWDNVMEYGAFVVVLSTHISATTRHISRIIFWDECLFIRRRGDRNTCGMYVYHDLYVVSY